ncbi:hypothetical protein BX592_11482 [Paraburkholderia rhizosphaerae]|uniref:Uncharacterized protein n=2 Tax=Paraburkholderia rhizosphaerae TaxID=480658 RepID=A0A4V3HEC6_9BURK|nr:hypothetical protein BX592_11482 [Paraburkholderia rhizosphaerae]
MKTEGAQRDTLTGAQPAASSGSNGNIAVQPAGQRQSGDTDSMAATQSKTPDPQKPAKLATLAEYNTYAKYASTIVRQLLFGDSRFNNSKLVVDSVLSKLQVKGGYVPPGVRVGTLGLTRLNSATANFSKAASYIESAQRKRKAGEDATDDIVSATALMGEGFTEVTAGLGADVGNYLVKQWQTQMGNPTSIGSLPSTVPADSVVLEAGSGTPLPAGALKTDADSALAHTPAMSQQEHEATMAQSKRQYFERLDQQLQEMRDQQKQHIVDELEKVPDNQKPASLAELSTQAEGKIELAEQLVAANKRDISATKAQRESDFAQLEDEMKPIRDQLKSGKYTDASVAGLSKADAAERLGAKLLSYRRREEELAQGFELATEDVPTSLEMLNQQVNTLTEANSLAGLTPEQQVSKLEKLKTDYRENFLKYQKAISAPSENLPEWLKISPALKAQLGPAAINTTFAVADMGARIDSYIKKVASGSVTTQDKLNLAASVLGVAGGMSSFIPVFGPFVSIGFALAGIALGNISEELEASNLRERTNTLRDEVVDIYQKKHPGSENYVYKSDVGVA